MAPPSSELSPRESNSRLVPLKIESETDRPRLELSKLDSSIVTSDVSVTKTAVALMPENEQLRTQEGPAKPQSAVKNSYF